MFKRRNIYLLLAGAAVFITTAVCGLGAQSAASPPPAPTMALIAPSEEAGSSQPTSAAAPTSFPGMAEPTATMQGLLVPSLPPAQPAISESRRVTLEYPPNIRAGDSDVVRLTLEVDTLGNVTPTAETKGNKVTGKTVKIPNLYDTHNVIAEARLDLAGVDVRPSGEISEPLLPGESVTFYWSVHPTASGAYRGTVWLFLRFVDKVTKEESRKAVSAQSVQITTRELFEIGGSLARTVGGVGSVVGAVLGCPFADDVLKWFLRRLRRKQ